MYDTTLKLSVVKLNVYGQVIVNVDVKDISYGVTSYLNTYLLRLVRI